jgi:UDP-N-acetylmuramyl tripeptide synthase
VAEAGRDDVVLIAGRGPERELQLGSSRIPLVDADVAEAALRLR